MANGPVDYICIVLSICYYNHLSNMVNLRIKYYLYKVYNSIATNLFELHPGQFV